MPQTINEASLLFALQACQKNPKLSLRRAANLYDVDHQRLSDRRNGIQARADRMPNLRRLSDLEEETIVQFILDLDSQ
ncbi:fot5 transposase [Fusarium oxysporum f. sp. phaseoli]